MLWIIEGNALARTDLLGALRTEGYEVLVFADGPQALGYLRSGHRPDLVLLDVQAPSTSADEFLCTLRNWSRPLFFPIIVTTGGELTREWAAAQGCTGFLRKPFERGDLLAEIHRCLGE
jgi:CheY-like chemotaxis protein